MSNETIEKLNQCLKNPDRRHAIYPIIHHKVAENPELVDWAEKHWFAGIVGNVPYNRDFPNDQNDWNDTCNGFKKYIDRGMFTWIYDEKGYPSGSAGGTVPEMNKDFKLLPKFKQNGFDNNIAEDVVFYIDAKVLKHADKGE